MAAAKEKLPPDLEALDFIFDKVAEGWTLSMIFEAQPVPNSRQFYRWLREHPDLRTKYEAAQEEQAERMVSQMLDLVDAVDEDNNVAVAAARLKTDIRKWTASRYYQKKFGDKQQVDMNANVKTDYESILEAARRRSESGAKPS